METCLFCQNPRAIHCDQCQVFSCPSCAITQHLTAPKYSHIMRHLCEECEEEIAVEFCENCDQNLCSSCNTRIHNKGKRAKHSKKVISEPLTLDKIQNLAFITAAFFEECLNLDHSIESLKTNFLELAKDMNLHNSHEINQCKFSIILLEKDFDSKQEDNYNLLIQAMEELKIKNLIIVQNSQENERKILQEQKDKEFSLSHKRVSSILQLLKALDTVESVYFYDVYNNEQVAQLLNENNLSKSRQIFLNFDEEQNQPFSSSVLPQLNSLTKEDETTEAYKQEASFPYEEIISPETFFNNTQFSGLLTPESSFSSFEIPTKSKGTYNAFLVGSKENYHPNFFTGNFAQNENENIDKINLFNNPQFQFEPKKILVPETQPLKNVEIRNSKKIGDLLQEEIRMFANKGELLILKESLLSKLKETFQLRSLNEAENLLMEAEAKKIVHITIRKFPNESPYYYIGLLLNVLTLESLTWVIKSIKCDLMTPTEKLILSRIKECYGLKIDPNFWKVILNSINSQNIEKSTKGSKINCPLYVKQILDPVTNLETNALYLTNEEWIAEDQGQVDDNSDEWKALLVFIEDFFRDNTGNSQSFQEERERFNAQRDFQQNSSRWNNSVENILNRSSAENDRTYKINDDVKAIPGGRYGCAQFIKYCGPENLKDLSIGKLSLLVQEAINRGILRYQRTLLVKNIMNDSSVNLSNQSDFHNEVIHSLNAERKAKLMSMVKEALLEILMENPRGISLAQIPFHLKKKLKFNVDFQELGFPKLKNFLTTLKNLVIIESVGTNHTCVKLKEPLSAQMNQGGFNNRNMYQKKRLGDIDKVGLRMNQYQRSNEQGLNIRNFEMQNIQNIQNIQNEQIRPENELRRITEKLRAIVTSFRQGIPLLDLYRELCNQLKVVELNFLPFGCENFYQFLLRYADQIVDISVKKNGFIIYPKAQDFWVKGQESSAFAWQKFETPGKTLRSPPGFYEGQGMYMEQKSMNQMIDPRGLAMGIEQKFKSQGQFPGFSNRPMDYQGQQMQNRPGGNTYENPNFLNISPIIFPGNEGNEVPFMENRPNTKYTNVNVSTWNLNYNYGQQQQETISEQGHLPWQFNQQNQRKQQFTGVQPQEESQLELQNNLKFIEELLQNDEEKGLMGSYTERSTESSIGGFNITPNQSFSGRPFAKNRS